MVDTYIYSVYGAMKNFKHSKGKSADLERKIKLTI